LADEQGSVEVHADDRVDYVGVHFVKSLVSQYSRVVDEDVDLAERVERRLAGCRSAGRGGDGSQLTESWSMARSTVSIAWTTWTRCDSYYRSPTGRIVTQWPHSELDYARATWRLRPRGWLHTGS
jgi:hypothetical protein